MIIVDKVIKFFCATNEFFKKFDKETENMPLLGSDGKTRRKRSLIISVGCPECCNQFDKVRNIVHRFKFFAKVGH